MVTYVDYRTLNIRPSRGANGAGCFTKYDIRRLHNALYCEDHEKWDPWA